MPASSGERRGSVKSSCSTLPRILGSRSRMEKRFSYMIRLFIFILFLAGLLVMGYSNNNTDPISVWIGWKGIKVTIGMFSIVLASLSFLVGLLIGWLGEFRQRRRARLAESKLREAEKQVVELHQRLDRAQSQNPAAAMQKVEDKVAD
ncbi:LapA family protein [Oecophyllibacter saccharovorans]|nr:LapA family protein [Oecophyllibacter saccharovorans]